MPSLHADVHMAFSGGCAGCPCAIDAVSSGSATAAGGPARGVCAAAGGRHRWAHRAGGILGAPSARCSELGRTTSQRLRFGRLHRSRAAANACHVMVSALCHDTVSSSCLSSPYLGPQPQRRRTCASNSYPQGISVGEISSVVNVLRLVLLPTNYSFILL